MIEPFPPTENALSDPNGLLAVGGDLSAERLYMLISGAYFPGMKRESPFCGGRPIPAQCCFPVIYTSRDRYKSFLTEALGRYLSIAALKRLLPPVLS